MSGYSGACGIPCQSFVPRRRDYVDDVTDDLGVQSANKKFHEVRHEVRNKTEKRKEGVASQIRQNGSYSAAVSGGFGGSSWAAWRRGVVVVVGKRKRGLGGLSRLARGFESGS